MLVRRFTFTVLAFTLFVAALYHEGLLSGVSGETVWSTRVHVVVKQGVTQDGAMNVAQEKNTP